MCVHAGKGPSRRFKRVVETIQAQLLSTHDQPSVQALVGESQLRLQAHQDCTIRTKYHTVIALLHIERLC